MLTANRYAFAQEHSKNEVNLTYPQITSEVSGVKKKQKQKTPPKKHTEAIHTAEGQKDSQGRSLEY